MKLASYSDYHMCMRCLVETAPIWNAIIIILPVPTLAVIESSSHEASHFAIYQKTSQECNVVPPCIHSKLKYTDSKSVNTVSMQLHTDGWLSLKESNSSKTGAGIYPYSSNVKDSPPHVYFRETFDSVLLKQASIMFLAAFPDIMEDSLSSLFIATWQQEGKFEAV